MSILARILVPNSRQAAYVTQQAIRKLRNTPKWANPIHSLAHKLECIHMDGCLLRGWYEEDVFGLRIVGPFLGAHKKNDL